MPDETKIPDFDEHQFFKDEVFPLLDTIRRLCDEHQVSFIASFCTMSEKDKGFRLEGGTYLHGPERTPPEMVIAHAFMSRGIVAGILEVAKNSPVEVKIGASSEKGRKYLKSIGIEGPPMPDD